MGHRSHGRPEPVQPHQPQRQAQEGDDPAGRAVAAAEEGERGPGAEHEADEPGEDLEMQQRRQQRVVAGRGELRPGARLHELPHGAGGAGQEVQRRDEQGPGRQQEPAAQAFGLGRRGLQGGGHQLATGHIGNSILRGMTASA